MNIDSRTNALQFPAPLLPDGVFTGTIVVIVTAFSRYGKGPASDPEDETITGTYVCV